ncbi:hypothetical protein F5Y04DRAFT_277442 [Hypomontagnella monticulosa]|nr:hypothetical protein F5Y04DRAFT_277442 [Hypomontagnella monticulosa]
MSSSSSISSDSSDSSDWPFPPSPGEVNPRFATTIGLERMLLDTPERTYFQKMYLWSTSLRDGGGDDRDGKDKKTTVKTYNPATDAPSKKMPSPILPGEREQTPHRDAKLYLEVGLVIGDDPGGCKPTKAGRRSKRDDAERRSRLHERDDKTLHAFIPVHEYIQPQAKFFVGCRRYQGRYYPRVIEAATIFFYPEFWHKLDIDKPAKQRLLDMTALCKHEAAIQKMTEAEAKLRNTAADTAKYGVYAGCDGVKAFMDFNTPLAPELAAKVCDELKAVSPNMTPVDADVVTSIHQVLCAEEDDDGIRLGDHLSCGSLGFFLEFCQLKVPGGGYDEAAVWEVRATLMAALQASKMQNHHPTQWTASNED